MTYRMTIGIVLMSAAVAISQEHLRLTQAWKTGLPYGDVACADFDGDGDLDLVSGLDVLWNDGDGIFSPQGKLPVVGVIARSHAAGDIDGDGDVDLVLSDPAFPAYLLINDGRGNWSVASSFRAQNAQTLDVVLCDLENDGDLDIVTACGDASPGSTAIYVNDGKGNFTDESVRRTPIVDMSEALAAGDVDGDGDVDLVYARNATWVRPSLPPPWERSSTLLLNDGRGFFKAAVAGWPLRAEWSTGVVLADLDGDGDLDAFFAGVAHELYTNDGKGRFADATASFTWPLDPQLKDRIGPVTVLAFDADRDGDNDLLTVSGGGRRTWLFLNDGRGGFATDPNWSPNSSNYLHLAAADTDGDGDLDVVAAAAPSWYPGPYCFLWSNLERQIAAPAPAQIAASWPIELWAARPGVAALTYLALGRGSLTLPDIGTLRLDVGSIAFIGTRVFTGSNGWKQTQSSWIPHIQELIGRELSAQALYFETGTARPLGFSNVIRQRIR